MGDSFTEGISIGWDQAFVGIISNTLERQGIEVLNGAVVSYCPLLEKIRLRSGKNITGETMLIGTSKVIGLWRKHSCRTRAFLAKILSKSAKKHIPKNRCIAL